MTPTSNDHHDPSPTIWTTEDDDGSLAFDEECSPTRVCRNVREFSFDGIAAEGSDLKTAWRETLEREGKFSHTAESIRDLVLGQTVAD